MTAFLMFSSILWVINYALTNSFSYITLIQSSSIKFIPDRNYLLRNNYIQMKKKVTGHDTRHGKDVFPFMEPETTTKMAKQKKGK